MENIPGGGVVPFFLLRICHSSLATGLKFFLFKFLRTLLQFFALVRNSTRFFSIASALFAKKKHAAWAESKNGGALPAVVGASAERAYRLQERRSLTVLRSPRISTVLRPPKCLPSYGRQECCCGSVFRWRRRRRHIRQKLPSVALLDGVVRGYREQRRRRFRPLNVG